MDEGVAVDWGAVERTLDGQGSYDQLGDVEQAAVRVAWRERVDRDLAGLDLRARFEAEGRTRWSEADAHGQVVVHRRATGAGQWDRQC